MREAVIPGYRLQKARVSTKVLISLGMIGLLLGLLSSAGMTAAKTGLSVSAVQLYYLGAPASDVSAGSAEDDALGELLTASAPRPFAELAEVTHLHLMGGSLMLFLLCHLLSVCDVDDRLRTGLYLASFTTFISTFASPWLIIYVSPVFAYLFAPSILTLIVCLTVLCLIPLREMWWKQKQPEPAANTGSGSSLHVVHGSKVISR